MSGVDLVVNLKLHQLNLLVINQCYMKNLYILLSLLFLSFPDEVVGQSICGSELNLSSIQKNDPNRNQKIMELEELSGQFINSSKPQSHEQLHVTMVPW